MSFIHIIHRKNKRNSNIKNQTQEEKITILHNDLVKKMSNNTGK